jgi:hypothetical protein
LLLLLVGLLAEEPTRSTIRSVQYEYGSCCSLPSLGGASQMRWWRCGRFELVLLLLDDSVAVRKSKSKSSLVLLLFPFFETVVLLNQQHAGRSTVGRFGRTTRTLPPIETAVVVVVVLAVEATTTTRAADDLVAATASRLSCISLSIRSPSEFRRVCVCVCVCVCASPVSTDGPVLAT